MNIFYEKDDILKSSLRFVAKRILKRYKPRVVAITGSVGKSTAKEMIYTGLCSSGKKLVIGKSEKNYNNEIGVSLAIIGVTGEKKNVWQWLGVLMRSIFLLLFFKSKKYPKILVLEFGADCSGDIRYFCDFIPVEIGVLTSVGISHLENFGNRNNIFKEKITLLECAQKGGCYNANGVEEDEARFINRLSLNYLKSYAIDVKEADFKLMNIKYIYNQNSLPEGMSFKLKRKDMIVDGSLIGVLGRPYLYGLLSAVSVAEYFQIEAGAVLKALRYFKPLPGHMNLIAGIKDTLLIDDTYNSAPDSVKEALKVVERLQNQRKIIVLGDMLELGSRERKAHREIGMLIANIKNCVLVSVGENMKEAKNAFNNNLRTIDKNGEKEWWFSNSDEAGKWLRDFMKKGDVVLVKGSQSMRMEKVVEQIMANPNRKKELLVRQNKDWKS